MSSLLQRFRKGSGGEEVSQQALRPPAQKRRGSVSAPPKDQNVPQKSLQIHQRCLYERTLPGNAFISAHVNRLQHGYYDSSALHEPVIDDVYFVSVHFVFHPHDPRSHRFKSAEIEVCVHGDNDSRGAVGNPRPQSCRSHPRILKHAPELMFGAVSPENLQWNFSLSSSLGVSQAPVSATLNPSGGMKGSYKVFHMMSIQGSLRSKRSPLGREHDIEDATAIWTLEENVLQKSGLPREFDFVLLVHKPDDVKNLYMTVNVDADIEAWYGTYPQWYTNISRHMPNQDFTLDFNTEIGQRFLPSQHDRGFNFASLPHALDEYVIMPGTVYPTNDTKQEVAGKDERVKQFDRTLTDDKAIEASITGPTIQQPIRSQRLIKPPQQAQSPQNRHSWAPENVNVRVVLEHQYPQGLNPRRFSFSPIGGGQEPTRQPSIRRREARSGLKEYGAAQALREMIQSEKEAETRRVSGRSQLNGHPL